MPETERLALLAEEMGEALQANRAILRRLQRPLDIVVSMFDLFAPF